MAQEVKISIATVGAQQATQQTKTLKQQIKELRDELGQLTAGTEEYNQKIQELGNLMHQQSEITAEAKKATDDYGQTLSNLSGIASGVVGSITAINGVMNLVGAGNEDAMKAVKTMTSLMGILQGLNALDGAEKAFKGLMTRIKSTTVATKENTVSMKENSVTVNTDAASLGKATIATKAQGVAAATATKGVNLLSLGFRRLGLAIKAFMMSNPFTLILVAITAIYSIVSNIIDKQRQATEEMEKQKQKIREINLEYGASQNGSTSYTSNELGILGRSEVENVYGRDGSARTAMLDPNNKENNDKYEKLYTNWKKTLQKMEEEGNKFTENYKNKYRDFLNSIEHMQVGYVNWLEKEIERINGLQSEYENARGDRKRDLEKEIKKLADYEQQLGNFYQSLGNNYIAWSQYVTEFNKSTASADEAKRKQQLAEAQNNMQKDLALTKEKFELKRKEEENAYNREEKSTKEHWEREKEIEKQYWDEISKKYENYVKRELMTQQQYDLYREQHLANLLAIEKNIHNEILKIWEHENNPDLKIALENAEIRQRELMMEYNDAVEANKRMLNAQLDYENKSRELREASLYDRYKMLDKWNRESFELEYQAQQQKLNLELEGLQKEQEARWEAYDRARAQENEQFEYEKEYNRQALSKEEYDRKLEDLELQHQERLKQIQNEYIQDTIDTETQVAEIRYELAENEYTHEVELFNRKMDLTRQYLQAFSTMVGGVQGLLTELQGAYEQGSKEYEAIEEANIIMSGITGALQAWQSGMAAAPAPWNLAIAAAMAGISTATTIAALANLKSKKLSSSAASAPTVNPYETLSYETNSNIEGNIQDQRVVVVEQDITDTVNRVNVAETEASF